MIGTYIINNFIRPGVQAHSFAIMTYIIKGLILLIMTSSTLLTIAILAATIALSEFQAGETILYLAYLFILTLSGIQITTKQSYESQQSFLKVTLVLIPFGVFLQNYVLVVGLACMLLDQFTNKRCLSFKAIVFLLGIQTFLQTFTLHKLNFQWLMIVFSPKDKFIFLIITWQMIQIDQIHLSFVLALIFAGRYILDAIGSDKKIE